MRRRRGLEEITAQVWPQLGPRLPKGCVQFTSQDSLDCCSEEPDLKGKGGGSFYWLSALFIEDLGGVFEVLGLISVRDQNWGHMYLYCPGNFSRGCRTDCAISLGHLYLPHFLHIFLPLAGSSVKVLPL